MRLLMLLLPANALLSTGCSALIAPSGQQLETLATRAQIHERFCKPRLVGTVDGQAFEEYRTRRTIAEGQRAYSTGAAVIMTYGLAEVVAFPYEVGRLACHTLVGQKLRFVYDADNRVTDIYLNGERLPMWPFFCPVTPDSAANKTVTTTAHKPSLQTPK